MARIGFIGLGNMGRPMAANLCRAGHEVIGFDLAKSACVAARDAGIAIAASGSEAASGADLVVTMLTSGEIVRKLYGESGVLEAVTKGTLFIDCSTIDVASSREAHAIAGRAGMASLDAPVSGGVSGAEAGTLTFMVGGETDAFRRGEPILSAIGRKIVHCGDAGAGQAAKICNNMILGVSMIAVAEAFALADAVGLDRQALFDVASTSSGQCWSLTTYCPVPGPVPASPANKEYRPGFAAGLMVKDLTLAEQAAEAAGVATDLGHHARAIYAAFAEAGHGGEDFSAIFREISARSRHGGGS